MLRKVFYLLFICLTLFLNTNLVHADVATPASNLAGLKQVQDRIEVLLSLKGADEFAVESSEIGDIVRSALSSIGISIAKGGYDIPSIHVAVTGESAGGGGAQYSVEIIIRALIPSTLAKNRSIDAIIWRNSTSGSHLSRYDPVSKTIVIPNGTIKDRVYNSVREVLAHLTTDIKIAGTGE